MRRAAVDELRQQGEKEQGDLGVQDVAEELAMPDEALAGRPRPWRLPSLGLWDGGRASRVKTYNYADEMCVRLALGDFVRVFTQGL